MQIRTNLNTQGLESLVKTEKRLREVGNDEKQIYFHDSDELESALKATPGTRSSEIERARALVADPSYPPVETLSKISNLLALKFGALDDESEDRHV